MGFYENRVLPHMINRCMGNAEARRFRPMATAGLQGVVVEVGFGSGHNLPHYPAGVEKVIGIDPSLRGRELAADRIAAAPFPVELVGLDGQQLPLDDGSADAVLTTWTLCSIPDVHRALTEMRRVLRPGGRIHFLEHGRHPDPRVQVWQRRINHVQRRLFGGCVVDRPIVELIAGAGLDVDHVEHHQMKGPKSTGYLSVGTAVAAAG